MGRKGAPHAAAGTKRQLGLRFYSASVSTLPSLPDHRVYYLHTVLATIHGVKAYRIERIKGGMKFSCKQCAHSVTTLEFDAKVGNLRTQAATSINAHATAAHQAPMVISAPDSQQRSWR
jgi:hypothetical protein